MGKKKRPSYRIVAAEHSSPRDGRFIETLGHYDPLTEPATIKINAERAQHWLSVGAQPTETVAGLLKRAGVTGGEAVAETKA
jgi:small subunit ribosomal protein S16